MAETATDWREVPQGTPEEQAGGPEESAAQASAEEPLMNDKTKLVDVRESIRYRRRAQEAERRCAALEEEAREMRQSQDEQTKVLAGQLASERRERESLQERLEQLELERGLERELVRAGARDPETALLVARERLSRLPSRLAADEGQMSDPAATLAALAREVLDEKPYLKAAQREDIPPLGRPAQGVRPRVDQGQARLKKLAESARTTGRRSDLCEYMRARRQASPPVAGSSDAPAAPPCDATLRREARAGK